MKLRSPKDDDQEKTTKAVELIKELAMMNPGIEASIWTTAFLACVATCYESSGISYEAYCENMTDAMQHYKSWWE
jgi:hypothetical protein